MSTKTYDALSSAVFIIGVAEGVVPLVARPFTEDGPFWALPRYLPSPAWWIVSVAVIAVALVLLTVLDAAKKRGRT